EIVHRRDIEIRSSTPKPKIEPARSIRDVFPERDDEAAWGEDDDFESISSMRDLLDRERFLDRQRGALYDDWCKEDMTRIHLTRTDFSPDLLEEVGQFLRSKPWRAARETSIAAQMDLLVSILESHGLFADQGPLSPPARWNTGDILTVLMGGDR